MLKTDVCVFLHRCKFFFPFFFYTVCRTSVFFLGIFQRYWGMYFTCSHLINRLLRFSYLTFILVHFKIIQYWDGISVWKCLTVCVSCFGVTIEKLHIETKWENVLVKGMHVYKGTLRSAWSVSYVHGPDSVFLCRRLRCARKIQLWPEQPLNYFYLQELSPCSGSTNLLSRTRGHGLGSWSK